jgi:hypothetical protein
MKLTFKKRTIYFALTYIGGRAYLAARNGVFGMLAVTAFMVNVAHAQTYQSGHITRVSYATNGVLIMLDAGPPTNCSGTPFGWMMMAPQYTAMISWVTGLWFQGTAASVQVTVYTTGIDGTGYCQINQIDTLNAGSG